jgi:signal transduction histidine kinase
MTCPRCQEENPPRAKFCLQCGTSFGQADRPDRPAASYAELQHSLSQALEQQAATSEILHAIAASRTDVQPVFDTIVRSGLRLLGGYSASMMLLRDDGRVDLAAYTSTSDAADASLVHVFPMPLASLPPGVRAIRERRAHAVEDVESDPDVSDVMRETGRRRGWRSNVFVPMLRDDVALGLISITRRSAGPFAADEIALLETFAAQAVIAIENVRLFTELRERTAQLGRSVDELTALGQVSQALSSTLDLDTVLTTTVQRAIELSGADGGSVYEYDEAAEEFRLRATRNFEEEVVEASRAASARRGALGLIAARREPVQITDISDPASYESEVRDVLLRMGYRALLAVPLLREEQLVGALVVGRKSAGEFAPGVIHLLTTFANQSALAMQNARLFRELAYKGRQLEAASQHKSEFLANMSHELRTPLNAIIGFSEVLGERMFGELNPKQDEYLKDIHASGQHLLSLINDILDLSKIEAGRMELEVAEVHLPTAIDSAAMLVRERAARRSIALHTAVDERLGQIRGDERKIRQVLLNLLSNAIKFTPEGGRIEVEAKPVDGFVEVSVSDTGVGIAPEDQEAVFEEFRQVGTADKKVEGTGLGLALSRKFVELHGGRIWVTSQIGMGSTFTFSLPLRPEAHSMEAR